MRKEWGSVSVSTHVLAGQGKKCKADAINILNLKKQIYLKKKKALAEYLAQKFGSERPNILSPCNWLKSSQI